MARRGDFTVPDIDRAWKAGLAGWSHRGSIRPVPLFLVLGTNSLLHEMRCLIRRGWD